MTEHLGRGVSLLEWLKHGDSNNQQPLQHASARSSGAWLALPPAAKQGKQVDLLLKLVLLIYVPGSYILYTHMMTQRRKVLKGKGKSA